MRKAIIVALVGGGLAIGGTAIASAGEAGPGPAGFQQDAGGPANGAQAADMVLRQAGGGRALTVEETQVDGRAAYRITFRTGSGTHTATIDAESGRISGLERGGGPQGGGPQGGGQQGGPQGGGQQGGPQGGGQQGGEYQWSWDFGDQGGPSREGTQPSK